MVSRSCRNTKNVVPVNSLKGKIDTLRTICALVSCTIGVTDDLACFPVVAGKSGVILAY